jgi:hypothetical protein
MTSSKPSRVESEYLPNGSEQEEGNPSHNGNGHTASDASRKAWQTARDEAAAQARTPFLLQNDEEIRALTDAALPPGAARLFCLIVKLAWQKQHGGIFKGRIGSLCISARRLAKKLHCNVKSFYSKRDKKTGAVRPGWIEQLVNGGYLWIAHHRIPNIPENKSLNVYNVACLVPRMTQTALPWSDGNWGGDAVIGDEEDEQGGAVGQNGNSDFSSPEGQGNTQSPEKGTSSGPQWAQPVPRNGNSPSPATGIASPPQRARAVPRNGNRLSPATGTGSGPKRAQAVGRNGHRLSPATGHKGETKEGIGEVQRSNGEGTAPQQGDWESEFKKWEAGLGKKFDRELDSLLEKLKAERTRLKDYPPADAVEKLRRVKLKIEAVNLRLLGPK